MPETDARLERVLNYDALREAENMTGKELNEDPETQAAGFILHMANSHHRSKMLEERDDTRYGLSIEEFIRILQDEGFEQVYVETFTRTSIRGNEEEDRLFLFWHPTDAMLLQMDSYQGRVVNSANVYLNFCYDSAQTSNLWGMGSSSPFVSFREDPKSNDMRRIITQFDAREGLRHGLNKLRTAESGVFMNPWKEPTFALSGNFDYPRDLSHREGGRLAELAAQRRYSALPEHVRSAFKLWDRQYGSKKTSTGSASGDQEEG